MSTAVVICAADPASDPRPNRMIRCLAEEFDVGVIARGRVDLPNVTCEPIPPLPPRSAVARLGNAFRLTRGRYQHIVWTPGLRLLATRQRERRPAFIAVHDLRLLPVALAIRGRGPGHVLFDAREYYPRHYEDLWWWRMLYQPMNRSLCRRFMPRADHVVTVSTGLAAEYEREFGVRCSVLPSLPAPRLLTPQPVDAARIRMVHHGLASPSRQLERMIELCDHLPPHFSLDLILMPSDPAYVARLERLAAARRNVRILPPLPFAQLVAATNQYDIGLFLVPPVSFNLRFALPNKFFEYIQSRLMVAIGPSPEMARYVREHDLGVVAADFEPETLGAALARLTPAEIQRYKENAHCAAATLNSNATDAIIRTMARGPAPTPLVR